MITEYACHITSEDRPTASMTCGHTDKHIDARCRECLRSERPVKPKHLTGARAWAWRQAQ